MRDSNVHQLYYVCLAHHGRGKHTLCGIFYSVNQMARN